MHIYNQIHIECARWKVFMQHLESIEVRRFEVIWRAATPVHDVLVLALAAQTAVPVGKPQVVVHDICTILAIHQQSVEKRLGCGWR